MKKTKLTILTILCFVLSRAVFATYDQDLENEDKENSTYENCRQISPIVFIGDPEKVEVDPLIPYTDNDIGTQSN